MAQRKKCQHMRWLAGEELADCGISPADLTLAFIHYFDTLSLLRLHWKSPIITLALCFTAWLSVELMVCAQNYPWAPLRFTVIFLNYTGIWLNGLTCDLVQDLTLTKQNKWLIVCKNLSLVKICGYILKIHILSLNLNTFKIETFTLILMLAPISFSIFLIQIFSFTFSVNYFSAESVFYCHGTWKSCVCVFMCSRFGEETLLVNKNVSAISHEESHMKNWI